MANRRRALLLTLLSAAIAVPSAAQVSGPPVGGPSGNFLGPPATTIAGFLGVWDFTWQGPISSGCPCYGTISIGTNSAGELEGHWKMKGGPARMFGSTGYDQNVWIGRFEQSDEADYPMRGHFRLESRDERLLTGSYQPEGAAIPFTWKGTR
jgi:hypothetical protein